LVPTGRGCGETVGTELAREEREAGIPEAMNEQFGPPESCLQRSAWARPPRGSFCENE